MSGLVSASILALQKKKEAPSMTPEEKQSQAYSEAHQRLAGRTYAPPSPLPEMRAEQRKTTPSLTEAILSYRAPKTMGGLMGIGGMPMPIPRTEPTPAQRIAAGFVSSIETPIQFFGKPVGLMPAEQRPPPAPDIMKDPLYFGAYLGGEVAQVVAGAYVGGKILSGIVKGAEFVGGKIEEQTGIAQRLKTSPLGEFYYGAKEKIPASPLKWKGSEAERYLIERVPEYRKYAERGITSGIVDVPDPTSVPMGYSPQAQAWMKAAQRGGYSIAEPTFGAMPYDYLTPTRYTKTAQSSWIQAAKRSGFGVGGMPSDWLDPLNIGKPSASELASYQKSVVSAMPTDTLRTEALGFDRSAVERWTKVALRIKPEKLGEPIYRKAPVFMKGMEAEKGAMSFAETPRTLMLDPELKSALELPITRQIFESPYAMPFIPEATSIRQIKPITYGLAGAMTLGLGVASTLGLSRTLKQPTKPSQLVRNVTGLGQPSRQELGLTPDVSSMLEPSLSPMLQPLTKTSLKPIQPTVMAMPPQFSLPRGTYAFPPYMTDSFDLEARRGRRKRGRKPYTKIGRYEREWEIWSAGKMANKMLGIEKLVRTRKAKKRKKKS